VTRLYNPTIYSFCLIDLLRGPTQGFGVGGPVVAASGPLRYALERDLVTAGEPGRRAAHPPDTVEGDARRIAGAESDRLDPDAKGPGCLGRDERCGLTGVIGAIGDEDDSAGLDRKLLELPEAQGERRAD